MSKPIRRYHGPHGSASTEPVSFDSATATALLSPERLDEIQAFGLYDCEQAPELAYGNLCHLLAHATALTARAEKAEALLANMILNVAAATRLVDVANATFAETKRTLREVDELLAESGARAEKAEAEATQANDCAQRACTREIDAITVRNKAEARVKELQAKLSEQEVAKLDLVQELVMLRKVTAGKLFTVYPGQPNGC